MRPGFIGHAVFSILPSGVVLAAEEKPIPILPIGAKAPEFDLLAVDGRRYPLTDFAKARIPSVAFTCNHCPTAHYDEEVLKRVVTGCRSKGVAVAAISRNGENPVSPRDAGYTDSSDSVEEMKILATAKEYNLAYLYEGYRTGVARANGPVATPHALVFDAEHRLRYVGRIGDSERLQHVKVHDLRNALDALPAGSEPPVRQIRVVW